MSAAKVENWRSYSVNDKIMLTFGIISFFFNRWGLKKAAWVEALAARSPLMARPVGERVWKGGRKTKRRRVGYWLRKLRKDIELQFAFQVAGNGFKNRAEELVNEQFKDIIRRQSSKEVWKWLHRCITLWGTFHHSAAFLIIFSCFLFSPSFSLFFFSFFLNYCGICRLCSLKNL